MTKTLSGRMDGTKKRFAVVAARFNEFITKHLVDGAVDTLIRHGVNDKDITVAWVPGSMEIPLAAKKIAVKGNVDAVLCLGAIIRGATPHHELVAAQCARGISQIGLETGLPVIFGVITAENIEQAIERAGTKMGNRGAEAAITAIEMAGLLEQLD